MVKEHFSPAYEEIARQIGIEINDFTINERFGKYFLKTKKCGVEEIFTLFENTFFVSSLSCTS